MGRRGGKSLVAGLLAVFLACFRDYRRHLAPGERATVMVIAADRRQARVVFRYISGFLEGISMLENLVERKTAETIDLANQVTIEVHTASFRSTRGYTIVGPSVTKSLFGARKIPPIQIEKSSMPSGREWPLSPARYSSVSAVRMPGGESFGRLIAGTLEKRAMGFSFGNPTPDP